MAVQTHKKKWESGFPKEADWGGKRKTMRVKRMEKPRLKYTACNHISAAQITLHQRGRNRWSRGGGGAAEEEIMHRRNQDRRLFFSVFLFFFFFYRSFAFGRSGKLRFHSGSKRGQTGEHRYYGNQHPSHPHDQSSSYPLGSKNRPAKPLGGWQIRLRVRALEEQQEEDGNHKTGCTSSRLASSQILIR